MSRHGRVLRASCLAGRTHARTQQTAVPAATADRGAATGFRGKICNRRSGVCTYVHVSSSSHPSTSTSTSRQLRRREAHTKAASPFCSGVCATCIRSYSLFLCGFCVDSDAREAPRHAPNGTVHPNNAKPSSPRPSSPSHPSQAIHPLLAGRRCFFLLTAPVSGSRRSSRQGTWRSGSWRR